MRALFGAKRAAAALGSKETRKQLRAHARLGRAARLFAGSSEELFERAAPFVDSSNDAAAGALWPLVKRVRVAGPWEVSEPLRS